VKRHSVRAAAWTSWKSVGLKIEVFETRFLLSAGASRIGSRGTMAEEDNLDRCEENGCSATNFKSANLNEIQIAADIRQDLYVCRTRRDNRRSHAHCPIQRFAQLG
jgi:hypothetical protein